MKKILGTTAAAALFLATYVAPLKAADLPPPSEPVLVTEEADWTGFYIGLQAGYGWGNSTFDTDTISFVNDTDIDGALVGIYGGFNWQNGSLVFGFEADANWSDVNGRTGPVTDINYIEHSVDFAGSLRLRAGLATENALFYITGGGAVADISHVFSSSATGNIYRFSDYEWSWTLGGGIEIAFANDWIGRIDYRYWADFDTHDPDNVQIGGTLLAHSTETDFHSVMLGVAKKF